MGDVRASARLGRWRVCSSEVKYHDVRVAMLVYRGWEGQSWEGRGWEGKIFEVSGHALPNALLIDNRNGLK